MVVAFSRAWKLGGKKDAVVASKTPHSSISPYKCGTTAHVELFGNVRLNLGFIITGQYPLGWVPLF